MKKTIALLMCVFFVLSAAACAAPAAAPAPAAPAAEPPAAEPAAAEPAVSAAPAEAATDDTVYTLKLSYSPGALEPEQSADIMFGHVLQQELEANAPGRFQLEVYPSNQLGSASEVITMIAGGTVEMGYYDFSLLSSYYKESMVLACPGLLESTDECNALLRSDWANALYAAIEEATGISVAGAHCKGMRCFTTSNKELKTVDDAAGVTFRVMDNQVYIKMVEALSANAVPMAGSEMYVAMQNGVVDGQENPPANILQDKTYEVQKYLVLDEHVAGINSVLVSGKWLSTLPDELKAVLTAAIDKAVVEANRVTEELNGTGVEKLADLGMRVYTPTAEEKTAWHEAVYAPCMDYIREQLGDAPCDAIFEAVQALR